MINQLMFNFSVCDCLSFKLKLFVNGKSNITIFAFLCGYHSSSSQSTLLPSGESLAFLAELKELSLENPSQ